MRLFLKHAIFPAYVLLICFLCMVPKIAQAQSSTGLTVETDLKIGVTTIYSPDSFAGWGKIRNSSSFSLRSQLWHSILSYNRFSARLGSELILTQRLNYPVDGFDGTRDHRTGIGIIPLNLLMPISTSTNIEPFAFFSAGGLFLNDKLPDVTGASLNYLLNVGAGIELPFIQKSHIQIGYSIQHMSNANTGDQNPGIDSHMFFITVLVP